MCGDRTGKSDLTHVLTEEQLNIDEAEDKHKAWMEQRVMNLIATWYGKAKLSVEQEVN